MLDNDQCNQTRDEMLERIKSLNFAIIELGLYLDTHPDDEKALCLHRKYCKEYRELTDKYQKVYGPLTIHFPCNKWRWLEEPWPSFNLETERRTYNGSSFGLQPLSIIAIHLL